ncbi:MAG: hypothetical protein D6819_01680 [Gammaproteobacteria bacterium]|nr:MAG: hypothetical protein D6819_01680 [Gammaproteobacteria bacterium]
MHWRNRLFVTLSLLYGLLGGGVALGQIIAPAWIPAGRLIHAHFMLLGFVAMMIYGIGLHVLPRFSGRALYSERLADVQLLAANLGLWLLLLGWWLFLPALSLAGGILAWAGMALFSINAIITVRPR